MANLKAKAVGDAIVKLQELNEEIRQRLVCLSAENLDETDAFVLEVIQTLVQIIMKVVEFTFMEIMTVIQLRKLF